MLRILEFLLIFAVIAFGATSNTKEKTGAAQKSLASNADLEKKLSKKLDELAKDIINGEKEAASTATQIASLQIQVKELEASAKAANASLNTLMSQNEGLIKEQHKIESSMLELISKKFAYDLFVPKSYVESEESIISAQILHQLSKNSQSEVNRLAKDYSKTINLIKTQTKSIEAIKFDLAEFRGKQEKLVALQVKQNKDIANLKADRKAYEKQLSDLQAQQKELRATLEKLAIVAKNEEEAAKKAQEEKMAKNTSKDSKNSKNSSAEKTAKNGDVRQVGSSYQMSSVRKYKGAKTIAPLEKYTLKQAFGDYTDPIYNIKIFNESVILRSNSADAQVRTVLDGKVVFAKSTSLLEKVVIVEHKDGIHTIYAHLSKIAPPIKVGARVSKGFVIGRVERDLTFEVTQQNYHINPMEMIAKN